MQAKIKIGINGLGRIGRCIVRAVFEYKELSDKFEITQINSPSANEMLVYLLKYDSTHGIFYQNVSTENEDFIKIGEQVIKTTHEKKLENLKWENADIVLECSGIFTKLEELESHIVNGAKKVILSCPAKNESIKTFVIGVNNSEMTKKDNIVSIGSCTTNCLAPTAKAINDNFNIKNGFVTTVHAYTNDQNILDNSHKKDLRRARTACASIIPTSTGAAKTISLVIPELKDKLSGFALRVPVKNVSVIDCVFNIEKSTTEEEVNSVIKDYAHNKMARILGYTTEKLVSIDFNHSTFSSIVDIEYTQIIEGKTLKILSWYDNEWAFSIRMLDMAENMIKIEEL
jgi:glyceraldehyde 3-phosphate dehydrogenase